MEFLERFKNISNEFRPIHDNSAELVDDEFNQRKVYANRQGDFTIALEESQKYHEGIYKALYAQDILMLEGLEQQVEREQISAEDRYSDLEKQRSKTDQYRTFDVKNTDIDDGDKVLAKFMLTMLIFAFIVVIALEVNMFAYYQEVMSSRSLKKSSGNEMSSWITLVMGGLPLALGILGFADKTAPMKKSYLFILLLIWSALYAATSVKLGGANILTVQLKRADYPNMASFISFSFPVIQTLFASILAWTIAKHITRNMLALRIEKRYMNHSWTVIDEELKKVTSSIQELELIKKKALGHRQQYLGALEKLIQANKMSVEHYISWWQNFDLRYAEIDSDLRDKKQEIKRLDEICKPFMKPKDDRTIIDNKTLN
jgi:hypothetical protein